MRAITSFMTQEVVQEKVRAGVAMKIGFLSLPLTGHLNPMTALARKLQSRGTEVVFFGLPDIEPIVRAAHLAFVPYCEREYPIGSLAKTFEPVAHLQGLEVMRYTIEKIMPDLLEAAFWHLPEKVVGTGVQAMVIDNAHLLAQLVPMGLNIPFVQICNALHRDPSGLTPPSWFSWPHETTPEARARNADGLKQINGLLSGILPMARAYAEKLGLKVDWNDLSSTSSKLAVITQAPAEFDFPGIQWPAFFHYAGPFHDNEGRETVPFPWERLTGQPLIYASIGTLVNGLNHIYATILEAISGFPEVQAVLSVGRNVNPDDLRPIPEYHRRQRRSTNRTAQAGDALHNSRGPEHNSGSVGPRRAAGGDPNRIRPTRCCRPDCVSPGR